MSVGRALVSGLIVIAYGLCALCLLAQVFPQNAFFEMALSFLPQILLMAVISTGAMAVFYWKAAIAGALFVLAAAWPVLSFSKYESPTRTTCEPGACLTVITANIHLSLEAMERVSALSEEFEADLIALNEPPIGLTEQAYRTVFNEIGEVIAVDRGTASAPIALLSRIEVAQDDVVVRPRTAFRAYVQADLAEEWSGLRVVTAHTMIPITPAGIGTRNALISLVGAAAAESGTFILMGDFNMTPWSASFRSLPGKRAGDPRFVSTWPVSFGPLGIPIDHILFSDDLELVETRILPPIGSDHRAVMARFKRKTPE